MRKIRFFSLYGFMVYSACPPEDRALMESNLRRYGRWPPPGLARQSGCQGVSPAPGRDIRELAVMLLPG